LKLLFEILYIGLMKIIRLNQAYDFPGFKALAKVREHPENHGAVIVTLKRTRKKKVLNVRIVTPVRPLGTTDPASLFGITTADIFGFIWNLIFGVSNARSAVL